MGQTVISAHTRSRHGSHHSSASFPVNTYTQNRKDGKKRKRKGQTLCQREIAEVVKQNFGINATPQAIHELGSLWPSYICNCKDSFVYDLVTKGIPPDKYREDTSIGADFTYQAPNWKGNGTHEVTVKGTNVVQAAFTVTSHCGPVVTVPSHHRPLSGRAKLRLVLGG